MSPFKRRILIAGVLLLGVGGYFASQNAVVRNLVHVVGYERTLDRYAQTDQTVTNVSARIDSSGRKATVLSAFYGLDNGLPMLSSLVICEGSDGADGLPIVFSHEIDPDTLEPGDLRLTTASGEEGEIACLTMAPADDEGELRTALLVGEFGSLSDQPVLLEVVGDVLSRDHGVTFKGAKIAVTPLEDGPRLVWAEIIPKERWNLRAEGTAIPWGGGTGCPPGTRQIVRATWDGGVSKQGGGDADDVERQLYQVTVSDPHAGERYVTPFDLADLGDGDNNHALCLDTDHPASSVSFPAGRLTDPREDLNPATMIAITRGPTD